MRTKSLLTAASFAALAAGSTAAKADLIVNGGFETGDTGGWTIAASFTDAAPSGFDGITAHSGNWFLALDDISLNATAAGVPEPAALSLFGLTLTALGLKRRRT